MKSNQAVLQRMADSTPSVPPPTRNKGFFVPKGPATDRPALVPSAATTTNRVGFFKTGKDEETGSSALLGLTLYSFVLLFFPIFVYFGAKQVLEDSFDFVPPNSVLAPAILAIASVNVVIVAYVIKAFREEKIQEKNEKEKAKDD
jgi:hypothetical protein